MISKPSVPVTWKRPVVASMHPFAQTKPSRRVSSKIATDLNDCLPDGIKIPEMFSAPTRLLSKYSQGRCWPLVGYDMCRTCLRYGRRPKNRRSVLEVTCEAYKCTLSAASPCLPAGQVQRRAARVCGGEQVLADEAQPLVVGDCGRPRGSNDLIGCNDLDKEACAEPMEWFSEDEKGCAAPRGQRGCPDVGSLGSSSSC